MPKSRSSQCLTAHINLINIPLKVKRPCFKQTQMQLHHTNRQHAQFIFLIDVTFNRITTHVPILHPSHLTTKLHSGTALRISQYQLRNVHRGGYILYSGDI